MIPLMVIAQFYGVLQLVILGSPTRTIRWRVVLLAFLAGVTVCVPLALLLEMVWTRLFAGMTHQSFIDALDIAGYSVDPFIEEVVKLLPLMIACLIPAVRRQLGLVDIILICAALGAGFGLTEFILNMSHRFDRAIDARFQDVWYMQIGVFGVGVVPGLGKTLTSWLPSGVSATGAFDLPFKGPLDTNI